MTKFTRNQRRRYASRMWKASAEWLAGMMTGCPWEGGKPCPEHGECGRCWLCMAFKAVKHDAKRKEATA